MIGAIYLLSLCTLLFILYVGVGLLRGKTIKEIFKEFF